MKYLIFILLLMSFLDSEAQQWEKAKVFNYIYKNSGKRHISDKDGNIYIIGDLDVEPIVLDKYTIKTNGKLDIFIAKLDSNFNVIWAKSFGGLDDDMFSGIALDNNNNIIVTGYYTDSIQFANYRLKSIGLSDFFIAKLDIEGDVIWAKSGGSKYQDYAYNRMGGVMIDSNNTIYTLGMFGYENHSGKATNYTATFDTFNITSFGNQDVFVASYSDNGMVNWVKNYGGYGNDIGEIYLSKKFIYIFGIADSRIKYEGGELSDPNFSDIGYVLKLDLTGKVIWAAGSTLTNFGTNGISSVTADSDDNVYIVGAFSCNNARTELKFDNFYLSCIGGHDFYIAKLNNKGKVIWLKIGGGGANDGANKIIKKENNHFIITGTLNQGGTYQGKNIISSSYRNTYILEIDNSGKPSVFEQCGNTGSNASHDISLTKNNKLLITGDNWSGTLTFDSITCQSTDKPASFYIARRNFIPKPVGIINVNKTNPFKIYPNPSSGSFTIELENANKNGIISIYNPLGMLIKTINTHVSEKSYLLNLDLVSGVYQVKVTIGDAEFSQRLAIIK